MHDQPGPFVRAKHEMRIACSGFRKLHDDERQCLRAALFPAVRRRIGLRRRIRMRSGPGMRMFRGHRHDGRRYAIAVAHLRLHSCFHESLRTGARGLHGGRRMPIELDV